MAEHFEKRGLSSVTFFSLFIEFLMHMPPPPPLFETQFTNVVPLHDTSPLTMWIAAPSSSLK